MIQWDWTLNYNFEHYLCLCDFQEYLVHGNNDFNYLRKTRGCTFVQLSHLLRYYYLPIISYSSSTVLPYTNTLFTLYFPSKVSCMNYFKNSISILGICFSVDFICISTRIHSPQILLFFFNAFYWWGIHEVKGGCELKFLLSIYWKRITCILQNNNKKHFYFANDAIEREDIS